MKKNFVSRLTVSMPDPMNNWVEAQVSAGRYGNVSGYFRDVARRDQERRERTIAKLRALMQRAEDGGMSARSAADVLNAAREASRQKGLLNWAD